ncbi:MAG TPA: RNA-binding S4 domain-containing protein [Firmicutes bacterium]|jgi:ribosome-associated protein|nr:RNA-binding S4 domain-containing protein [Bacillota bacterium]
MKKPFVEQVVIPEPEINLAAFLKWTGLSTTGGQAKLVIRSGQVMVNGVVETRPGKSLKPGDQVGFDGRCFQIAVE